MSFTSEQINSEKNVLMLNSVVHRDFGQFRLVFEATTIAHQYRIKTFSDCTSIGQQFLPRNRLVRFKVHKGSWDLPDHKLLEIHACIGNFLHMSGQAGTIDKVLRDFEDCGGLAPSGSTNIADLLAVSRLSLLSFDTKEISIEKQHMPEKQDMSQTSEE